MDYFLQHPWDSLTARLTDAVIIPYVWFGSLLEFWGCYRLLLMVVSLLLAAGLFLKKLTGFAVALMCIALMLSCASINFGKFEQQVWQANAFDPLSINDKRYWMANNLIASHLLVGKSHVDVQHILGEPDHYGHQPMGTAPNWCYVLRLKPHAYKGSLYVRFDENGRVKAVERGEYFSAKDDAAHRCD